MAFFGIGIRDSCSRRIGFTDWRFFCQTRRRQADLNQAEHNSPVRFFTPSGPAIAESTGGAAADSFQVLRKNLIQLFYQRMAALNL
jgi:hypothetical protein